MNDYKRVAYRGHLGWLVPPPTEAHSYLIVFEGREMGWFLDRTTARKYGLPESAIGKKVWATTLKDKALTPREVNLKDIYDGN